MRSTGVPGATFKLFATMSGGATSPYATTVTLVFNARDTWFRMPGIAFICARRSCTGNVPRPRWRCTRPSCSSRFSAARSVTRDTPICSANSYSPGIGASGGKVRSEIDCSSSR